MKILFVANRVPYPPFRGDKLKIFNLARRLAKHHEIHLITFAESAEDHTYKSKLEEIFKEVHFVNLPIWQSYWSCLLAIFSNTPFQIAYFRSRKMQNLIGQFLETHEIDVVHTQHLRMSQFTNQLTLPKILDLPDAFSLYWKRRIANQKNPLKKFFELIEYKRLFKFEGEAAKKFDLALVCSREDLNYMKVEHGVTQIDLLRNGVDLETFVSAGHDYSQNQTLLFTGNMDYAPNVDAVVYFVNTIFPIITDAAPNVKFVIAGQRPVKKVLELAGPKVEITGFVPDLKAMYRQAGIVVAPLRFGAGTQNKVLEAMAMGIPVVSGKIGFDGLEVENGEGVFLELTPELFAKRTIELLNSETLRRTTGEAGMSVAKSKFSWDGISRELEGFCERVKSESKG
jgi:sugar transferase (PEP-CTERM/EpsH1 system associated)